MPVRSGWRRSARLVCRWLLAGLFVGSGTLHFAHAAFFQSIVPPGFPDPPLLVAISGVCEMAGAVGLLIPLLRKAAGWGLIALLIAVFPANIYMAIVYGRFATIPAVLLWARLPVQVVLIAVVYFAAELPGS